MTQRVPAPPLQGRAHNYLLGRITPLRFGCLYGAVIPAHSNGPIENSLSIYLSHSLAPIPWNGQLSIGHFPSQALEWGCWVSYMAVCFTQVKPICIRKQATDRSPLDESVSQLGTSVPACWHDEDIRSLPCSTKCSA
jgi:hypothetical protein